jgi:hypothetical protein
VTVAELEFVPPKKTVPTLVALNVAFANVAVGLFPVRSLHPPAIVFSDLLLPASTKYDILPVTNLGPAFVAIS